MNTSHAPCHHSILLVDDEPLVLQALQRTLRRSRHPRLQVLACDSPAAALAAAAEHRFSLVISDYRMPGMNGVELLARLCQLQADCARVLLSGHTDLVGLIGAINEARIARFMTKPWRDAELLDTVAELLCQHEQRLDEQALADQARWRRGELSAQELELRRLERLEPGITVVHRDASGAVLLEPL